jgi:hypothetical protein
MMLVKDWNIASALAGLAGMAALYLLVVSERCHGLRIR